MLGSWTGVSIFLLALTGALLASPSPADQEGKAKKKTGGFSPPQLLQAGGREMGSSLLYPSPVLMDIDGDGTREMVIGGLRGYLSVARRSDKGWGEEVKWKAADGKPLKFHNW